MIEYFALILAIPIGLFLSHLTKDEKPIFNSPQYFPTILWILAIISAILFTTNRQLAIVTTFIFITTLVWSKAK